MLGILIPFLILGVLGGVFGLLLSFAAKKFAVQQDERIDKLQEVLPGANCGACGFPGCSGYAAAIVKGEAAVGLCVPGGKAVSEKMAAIMGTEAMETEKKVAFVHCTGSPDKAERRFKYSGIKSCLEASVIPGGTYKECRYGCLGLGSCKDACPFGAMTIENGIAKVDKEKCTGCGACVKACPKRLITLVPENAKIDVNCMNPLRGVEVKNNCKVGCIGCTLCARNCPEKAITMVNNLPEVDHSLCSGCGTCTQKCPVRAIVLRNSVAVIETSTIQ